MDISTDRFLALIDRLRAGQAPDDWQGFAILAGELIVPFNQASTGYSVHFLIPMVFHLLLPVPPYHPPATALLSIMLARLLSSPSTVANPPADSTGEALLEPEPTAGFTTRMDSEIVFADTVATPVSKEVFLRYLNTVNDAIEVVFDQLVVNHILLPEFVPDFVPPPLLPPGPDGKPTAVGPDQLRFVLKANVDSVLEKVAPLVGWKGHNSASHNAAIKYYEGDEDVSKELGKLSAWFRRLGASAEEFKKEFVPASFPLEKVVKLNSDEMQAQHDVRGH
jgi:hypothetical protein